MIRSRSSRLAGAAIGAGLAFALLVTFATPAGAQSRTSTSFSFGLSVGDPYYRYRSAWNDPWLRDPWFYGAPRRGARSWSCLHDPFCYRPYRSVRRPVYAAPPPVYMAPPPVVIYESRDVYDPMPRWRAIAPQTAPAYQQPHQQQTWQQPAQQQPIYQQPYAGPYAGAAQPFGEPPATMGGGVRFDLVQQGYTASDLGAAYIPPYDPYGAAPGVRFDQSGAYNGANPGVADSFIRNPWANPNDALLGGPR